jgi:hypothetical protein
MNFKLLNIMWKIDKEERKQEEKTLLIKLFFII